MVNTWHYFRACDLAKIIKLYIAELDLLNELGVIPSKGQPHRVDFRPSFQTLEDGSGCVH
jgi:hypothetical protein